MPPQETVLKITHPRNSPLFLKLKGLSVSFFFFNLRLSLAPLFYIVIIIIMFFGAYSWIVVCCKLMLMHHYPVILLCADKFFFRVLIDVNRSGNRQAFNAGTTMHEAKISGNLDFCFSSLP